MNPYEDVKNLSLVVREHYGIDILKMSLHREMIGFVYSIRTSGANYVFKLFRSENTKNAIQAALIISYLAERGFPVARIIPHGDSPYTLLKSPEGECVGVLFEYVEGEEPEKEKDIHRLGGMAGQLHNMMEDYPLSVIERGKAFYVDRYIDFLKNAEYDIKRIQELDDFGREAWERVSLASKGFCHGDFHTGNMIKNPQRGITLFDFDIASRSHSIIDAAVICDMSNFNSFNAQAFDQTGRMFEKFCKNYTRKTENDEYDAVFSFIAIRHYELIATITKSKGEKTLSKDFLDQQYHWLTDWRNLCHKKGVI